MAVAVKMAPEAALMRIIESGDRAAIAEQMTRMFLANVEVRDVNPEAPFLVWDQFKGREMLALARGVIEIAKLSCPKDEIGGVVMLPASMSWTVQHMKPTDFPNARIIRASRDPFPDALKWWVTSYTKKADGTRRSSGEPHEQVVMYVDPLITQVGPLMLFDDVMANGSSMREFATTARQCGVTGVYGAVGFSKNMQGGLPWLRNGAGLLDGVVACVEVERMENGRPVINEWWRMGEK